jgi:hypothetical protein
MTWWLAIGPLEALLIFLVLFVLPLGLVIAVIVIVSRNKPRPPQ